ncbi:AAA family ATPase [Candidatus Methylobacter oryzae]|uniref:AAA family ATPase n=1 Tax=Candidatus Methylobacter oryzae TaxID=2497749 RepID=A0ABY3C813_9GAMM|nr:AAA family ATPase [Candidatus Methylobacter oryzae]TRW92686.1 AAA family ATPase [Candidatus Methylobacter oryzae]
MAKIEGIRIQNFRGLKNVTLGKLAYGSDSEPLTDMTVVIGKNGVGKSTLFDVFGFLADALKFGVEEACDLHGRGGFQKIRSQGAVEPIMFEIYYRENENAYPITYIIVINLDDSGRPVVETEYLFQHPKQQIYGRDNAFLILSNGQGTVWKGEGKEIAEDEEGFRVLNFLLEDSSLQQMFKKMAMEPGAEVVELSDNRKLGIATLGALKQHPKISAFREFIEGWYLSYFTPDAARSFPLTGALQHLNSKGDNLANVVQYMEREYRDKFQSILDRIAEKIPGIDKIDTEKTSDGRLLLRFNDKGFQDPFYAQQMSDGTLKVFAYLLLLEDPTPPPFICIEEPENGLYHKLLEALAAEFRIHATGRKGGTQLFITTHQPYFVDALEPNEVWILDKGADGFSTIRRASDDELVKNMVAEGLPLGGLWYSDYLDAR